MLSVSAPGLDRLTVNQFLFLDQSLAHLGNLATEQLQRAIDTLSHREVRCTQALGQNATDRQFGYELRDRATLTISRCQLQSDDLRRIVTILKIAGDLERIIDLSNSVARCALAAGNQSPSVGRLLSMTELVQSQLTLALKGLTERDVETALFVWQRDQDIDAIHNSIFREFFTYMMEDPRNISACINLLFCAKSVERIGDHATNIAEQIYYAVRGVPIGTDRPKRDCTSSILVPVHGG